MKQIIKARRQRLDIINNLPVGGMSLIARDLGYSKSYVFFVLNGYKSDTSISGKLIIAEAEKMAAINIWKKRFCKFKTLL